MPKQNDLGFGPRRKIRPELMNNRAPIVGRNIDLSLVRPDHIMPWDEHPDYPRHALYDNESELDPEQQAHLWEITHY